MLSEQQMRQEIANVRDRAGSMREDYTRRGAEPKWDMVEQQIINPLSEVRDRVSEELARLKSKDALVPIDRDPVPQRYSELVRGYYENLGGGN